MHLHCMLSQSASWSWAGSSGSWDTGLAIPSNPRCANHLPARPPAAGCCPCRRCLLPSGLVTMPSTAPAGVAPQLLHSSEVALPNAD